MDLVGRVAVSLMLFAGLVGCGDAERSEKDERPDPGPPGTPDPQGILAAARLELEWVGVPSGTEQEVSRGRMIMLDGGGGGASGSTIKVHLSEDHVSVRGTVRIDNLTDEPKPLPTTWFLVDEEGEKVDTITATVGKDRRPIERRTPGGALATRVLVRSGQSLKIHLREMVKLERLTAGKRYRVRDAEHRWEWPLEPLPGHDDLYAESGCHHTFEAEIVSRAWSAVEDPPGGAPHLRLEFEVRIRNRSSVQVSFAWPFLLVGHPGGRLDEMIGTRKGETESAGAIPIPSGETRTLVYRGKPIPHATLAGKRRLRLRNPRYDLNLKLPPLPPE